MTRQVEPLKKVTVRILADRGPESAGTALAPSELTFIYGIGRDGITPFESLLAGRRVGDAIDLHVMTPEATAFFEHLAPLLRAAFEGRDAVSLNVRITGIDDAEGREVVKAMAEMASRAESDCGCGCR
ncbi:MAG: hypothetical protein R6V84_16750 [Desulfobacterales bacterium]